MLKLIGFLFHTLPLILAWLYTFVAIYALFAHSRQIKNRAKISVGKWLFALLNFGYVLFFLVTRIFFSEIWETVFSVAGVTALIISFVWGRYEDRRSGRRWWNW